MQCPTSFFMWGNLIESFCETLLRFEVESCVFQFVYLNSSHATQQMSILWTMLSVLFKEEVRVTGYYEYNKVRQKPAFATQYACTFSSLLDWVHCKLLQRVWLEMSLDRINVWLRRRHFAFGQEPRLQQNLDLFHTAVLKVIGLRSLFGFVLALG